MELDGATRRRGACRSDGTTFEPSPIIAYSRRCRAVDPARNSPTSFWNVVPRLRRTLSRCAVRPDQLGIGGSNSRDRTEQRPAEATSFAAASAKAGSNDGSPPSPRRSGAPPGRQLQLSVATTLSDSGFPPSSVKVTCATTSCNPQLQVGRSPRVVALTGRILSEEDDAGSWRRGQGR
jgi:hypothetical protein